LVKCTRDAGFESSACGIIPPDSQEFKDRGAVHVAKVTIGFGLLLVVLGVGSYYGSGMVSPTALIPAAFGVVFVVLGAIALKEHLVKHAMHGAAALALIGFLATARGLLGVLTIASGGTVERPGAVEAKAAMAAMCAVFLVLCVNSFLQARRARG